MRLLTRHFPALITLLTLLTLPAWADEPAPAAAPAEPAPAAAPGEPAPAPEAEAAMGDPLEGLPQLLGPADGKLGSEATLKIPAGTTFLFEERALAKFYELTGNIKSAQVRGVLLPADRSWFVTFKFADDGYVSDEDKDDLDATKILESLQKGQEEGNRHRVAQGLDALTLTGWQTPPKYDSATHNLEWGIKVHAKSGDNVNYEIRLLGRRGVMSVTLIADEAQIDSLLPTIRSLLQGYAFVTGEDYGSYKEGDKVAAYGLGGLLGVGTLAVLAKTGILAKFWKFIVAGVVGIGAFFSRIFGKKKKGAEAPPPA